MSKTFSEEEVIKLLDEIRSYEHECGKSLYEDERESKEFLEIFKFSHKIQYLSPKSVESK